ncbi:TonB-dependent receptor domain-containing protein [Hyphomicrobium sp. 99]|uniref:TonB-dependent receptor domain-containing protein n=1 Tax=Hyphomicrobium sp. 99 TaxID=1163419 RepID=UPI0012E066BD
MRAPTAGSLTHRSDVCRETATEHLRAGSRSRRRRAQKMPTIIRVKGVEFEAKAELTREFSIIAGYSYLDSKITKRARVGEIGERPAETPDHQASFWGQYHFYSGQLSGLELAAGVRYYDTAIPTTTAIRSTSPTTPSCVPLNSPPRCQRTVWTRARRSSMRSLNNSTVVERLNLEQTASGYLAGCSRP